MHLLVSRCGQTIPFISVISSEGRVCRNAGHDHCLEALDWPFSPAWAAVELTRELALNHDTLPFYHVATKPGSVFAVQYAKKTYTRSMRISRARMHTSHRPPDRLPHDHACMPAPVEP